MVQQDASRLHNHCIRLELYFHSKDDAPFRPDSCPHCCAIYDNILSQQEMYALRHRQKSCMTTGKKAHSKIPVKKRQLTIIIPTPIAPLFSRQGV